MSRDMRRVVAAHEKLERLYADRRFDTQHRGADLRAFLTHWVWLTTVERLEDDELVDRLTTLMPGSEQWPWMRIDIAIREDCPRFMPENWGGPSTCPVPTPRKARCGARGALGFRVTDPKTGEWEMVGYCRRHEAEGRAELLRQRVLGKSALPEPMPNTGGLGPSHASFDWPSQYRRVSPSWKPPAVGIIAADWPTTERVVAHQRPAFRALDGGGQVGQPTERPRFEVVR